MTNYLLVTALVPILLVVLWTISSTSGSLHFTSSLPKLYNKRICLLIAHPDDEAMFFAPTLLALTRPELGNHVKILCLSTGKFGGFLTGNRVIEANGKPGNADGLGEIRRKELQKSAIKLGLRHESDVFIIDDQTRFPDSMTTEWAADDIAALLAAAFVPSDSPSKGKGKGSANNDDGAPTATLDVLLTFDRHGISNHPNHRSLYHGAVRFLQNLMRDKTGYSCPVALYTLTSTNIVRKYVGVLDAPLTMALGALGNFREVLTRSKARAGLARSVPTRLMFVNSVTEWVRARSAMTEAHKSQMLWFRYGWITLGRYMVVNDLKRERI